MHTIIVKPVNSQFVIVWVKLFFRDGHQLGELDPILNGRNIIIRNLEIIDSLKRDFNEFRQANVSMEEYFGHNIIVVKRQHGEKFNLGKDVQLSYDKVISNINYLTLTLN